jgi:predicted AAA+ superfamily ATPase
MQNLKVTDRQSFSQFVEMLRRDMSNNPSKYQNLTTADFLDAISSYAQDIQGYYDNTNQAIDTNTPSWQTFADILMGAAMYE